MGNLSFFGTGGDSSGCKVAVGGIWWLGFMASHHCLLAACARISLCALCLGVEELDESG